MVLGSIVPVLSMLMVTSCFVPPSVTLLYMRWALGTEPLL